MTTVTTHAHPDLAASLSETVEGEVRFDAGARGLYATDASNYRQVPIGVVIPMTIDDVVATVEICRRHEAPILGRGGGTSLAGQSCNAGVVIDFSKYLHRVSEIDPDRRVGRVQPGAVLDDLRQAAEQHGLTFGPDPATHDRCTLGGMIGNNSCGIHAQMAGKTVDNIEELEILTYDGLRMRVGPTSDDELERIIAAGGRRAQIYRDLLDLRDRYADLIRSRFPDIPRRVSGYNLDELLPEKGFNVARALVGTESTCALVLEATTKLVHSPPKRTLVVLGFPDVYQTGDAVPDVLEFDPIGLEGIDETLVSEMKKQGIHPQEVELLPDGEGWLLVEFGGDSKDTSDAKGQELINALEDRSGVNTKLFTDPHEEERVWETREAGLGATAHVPGQGDAWPGWEDSAVAPGVLGTYLRELRELYDEYGYHASVYGHFGQGCVHTRIDFDLLSSDGVKRFRSFVEEAARIVVSHGGSLSGEHGDGQARGELLEMMYGRELVRAFEEFKTIWDPDWKMNPGKVVKPYRLDQNLRLGADFHPGEPKTHFAFPEDGGSFVHAAALRCVGVGLCRRSEGGTMCPSYMVTKEEMHSTRGRARLLYEMLVGDVVKDGWRDPHVKEALDLCLACKGCKSDCPVSVDMATYKAEFLSHYYRRRLRPRAAYAMGLIYWWSRLAARMPRLANFLTQTPGLRTVAKAMAGVAQQRSVPKFPERTFTAWFEEREGGRQDGMEVILWPDTFSNFLEPDILIDATRVLEAAGFQVTVPDRPLCCGRPLYDYGMLHLAKRQWRQILQHLRPAIRRGVPLVGVEPSCVAAFRDELGGLFPNDRDAERLASQTFTLGEFLRDQEYRPPEIGGTAIVHSHCQGKAVMGLDGERSILEGTGLEYRVLDSGCCGMAGSFGFEKDNYQVSIACGERVLLPAARQAPAGTHLVADGFSCREQIRQTTGRTPIHMAQLLATALDERSDA